MIKNIIPEKLSSKSIKKLIYPGKTAEEISVQLGQIQINLPLSHVIIHAGTNNLPVDSAEICSTKIEQ